LAHILVIGKLTYAASVWYGYASAADRQRLEAVLRRAMRTGLCSNDELTLVELVDRADDDLFEKVLNNPHRVLRNVLPDETVPYLWPPYVIGQAIMFLPCGFYLLSSFFLFFLRLISAAANWMSTILRHLMWPECEFRMQV